MPFVHACLMQTSQKRHRNANQNPLITPTILPTSAPSFLPFIAIETALAQLDINRIMRLAHPLAKLIPIADPRLIAVLHPRSKIVGAHPTRVHLAKQADELLRLHLLRERRSLRVVGRHGVQEGPGGAAELFDVRRAV